MAFWVYCLLYNSTSNQHSFESQEPINTNNQKSVKYRMNSIHTQLFHSDFFLWLYMIRDNLSEHAMKNSTGYPFNHSTFNFSCIRCHLAKKPSKVQQVLTNNNSQTASGWNWIASVVLMMPFSQLKSFSEPRKLWT